MPASPAIDTMERILFLKRSPQMAGLSTGELSAIAKQMRERFFQKGSVILKEGEPVSSTYVVVEGRVRITHRGQHLCGAGPGTALGAIGVLSQDYERVEAVAETEVLALELDAETLVEIFEDHFFILRQVIQATARRLLGLRRLEIIAHSSPLKPGPVTTGGMDLVERILFLRRGGPFRNSSINALAELAHGLREVTFEPGVALWSEGNDSGTVLLLVSGSVRCSRSGGSAPFQMGSGSPLGDLESVAVEQRWYTAVTETRVTALEGRVENLIDVLEDNFDMGLGYLATLSRQILDCIDRTAITGREMLDLLSLEEEPGFTSRHQTGPV
jgi:CRP-like cAMP-binding protein